MNNALVTTGRFDRVICSMMLHNLPTLAPLLTVLEKLLKPKGSFIFSIPHPCFNSNLVKITELKEQLTQHQLLLPNHYIKPETHHVCSKPKQPIKQISFHRPLTVLFNELMQAGLVMTGFVEPVANAQELPEGFLWAELSEIPPALISRWGLK